MRWFRASLLLCCLTLAASGQIRFRGVLLKDANTPRPVPVSGARVVVAGVGGKTTAPGGRFDFDIPSGWPGGKTVLITVHKAGYVINEPVDGEWNLPSPEEQGVRLLKVVIVPLGSKKLWSNLRVETYIRKLSDRAAKLSKEVGNLKAEAGKPRPIDFTYYLKEWASKYGFTPAEVKEEFDEWAKSAEGSIDYRVIGLREFYRKNFAAAAENFEKAGAADIEDAKRLAERASKKFLDGYQSYKFAGNSLLLLDRYTDAIAKYNLAKGVVSPERNPAEWGEILNLIGVAKKRLGERVEGREGVTLLTEAIAAQHQAREVFARARLTKELASAETDLGDALHAQAARVGGDAETRLLSEAVSAFGRSLALRSRADDPAEWGRTNNSLGGALNLQALRASGQEARDRLFDEAVAAYRRSLEVAAADREQQPEHWVVTQVNLSSVFIDRGGEAKGEAKQRLLGEAVAMLRDARREVEKSKDAELRALTLMFLGRALTQYGKELDGEEGDRLLGEAAKVFEQALSFFTRESAPQYWAVAQVGLGTLYFSWAQHTSPYELIGSSLEEAVSVKAGFLQRAATCLRNALEVLTKESTPGLWAMSQQRLGNVLGDLAEVTREEDKIRALVDSAAAYRSALEVLRSDGQPVEWVMAQNGLGSVLYARAKRADGVERGRLVQEAIAAYRQTVQALSPEKFPNEWVEAQWGLSNIYDETGDIANAANAAEGYATLFKIRPDAEKSEESYERAISIYQDVIFQYEKAFELNRLWLTRHPADFAEQINFAEKHFTTGRFAEGQSRVAALLPRAGDPFELAALQVLEIFNLMALGKADAVPAKLDALIQTIDASKRPRAPDFVGLGVRHFIGQHQALPYRQWLAQFHSAVRAGGRDKVLTALREARDKLKSVAAP